MKSFYNVLPFLALVLTAQAAYHNQKVLRFPKNDLVLKSAQALNLDVWGITDKGIDIRVTPNQRRLLGQRLGPQAVAAKVLIEDLEEHSEAVRVKEISIPSPVTTTEEFHQTYHSYEDFKEWLRQIQKKYSSLAILEESIGKSVEGRDIPLIKLNGVKGPNDGKKRVWIQAMQHAREWIAGSTGLFIIDHLLSNYGKDSEVTQMLDTLEVVVVPICNPDGYTYTRTPGHRYWRKNRGEGGKGVDINRNWPDHWEGEGSSTDPESNIYRGEAPASSPEIKALMARYQATPNVIAAFDVHTYGHLIIRPYGWTQTPSVDEESLKKGGEILRSAFRKVNGIDYENKYGFDNYQVNGGAKDWFYGLGTKVGQQKPYSYTLELTDDDFDLPPTEIITTGKETVAAVIAFAKYAQENPLGVKQEL